MKKLFIVVLIILVGWFWWSNRSITHGPGITAPHAPVQETVTSGKPFHYKEYTLTPLADFNVKARVLSKKKYSFGREAELSPFDLALGWGKMSDESVLNNLKISQSRRFYFWRARTLPIPEKEITETSCNMHLIPANDTVRKELKRVRKGNIVRFKGYLVYIEVDDGWKWKSSTSRKDSGKGACELVWVEELNIE